MTSVERVLEYTQLPQEPGLESLKGNTKLFTDNTFKIINFSTF